MYMSRNEVLKIEIIQLYYNVPVAGHERKWKITELVTKTYWQLRVIRDVKKYVEGCDMCQSIKNRIETPVGKLNLSEVPKKQQTYLTVDFITKLLLVARKNAVLVVCNKLSKIIYFVATIEKTLVEKLARLFRDNIQKLHGFLESIVLDGGPQFAVDIIRELNLMLEIETKLLISFHPQTDEQIECMNQELEQYL